MTIGFFIENKAIKVLAKSRQEIEYAYTGNLRIFSARGHKIAIPQLFKIVEEADKGSINRD